MTSPAEPISAWGKRAAASPVGIDWIELRYRESRAGRFREGRCPAGEQTALLVREADRLALRAKLAPAFLSGLGLSPRRKVLYFKDSVRRTESARASQCPRYLIPEAALGMGWLPMIIDLPASVLLTRRKCAFHERCRNCLFAVCGGLGNA
jgi:hypothetical protein